MRQIIIKLMSRPPVQEASIDPNFSTIDSKPEKEEWAIINKYKALEFERMKAKERELDREKKITYRQELDNQLNSRNNHQLYQKQQDRLYYEHLSSKAEQQRLQEEAQKLERVKLRKHLDTQNIQKLEDSRNRPYKDGDTGYHLEIGLQSEKEHKEKSDVFRKEMMDTLDMQLRQKDEQQRKSKLKNMEIEQMHKKMQDDYFKPKQRKVYNQNEKIYQYYSQIEQQRQLKEEELNAKFVQEARLRKEMMDAERQRQESAKKQAIKTIVKDTLGEQMRHNQRKRIEDSITNPQLLSYGCMASIFQQKYQGYNKEQYKRELLQQAEQQKQKRRKQNHMSEEQYKFNMNQLSKAVSGEYSQKNYLDRSLGAIGDRKKYQLDTNSSELRDKDADVIKMKLNSMRNRSVLAYAD